MLTQKKDLRQNAVSPFFTGEIHRTSPKVGLTGIEPALLSELEPKSSASASSATAPFTGDKKFSRSDHMSTMLDLIDLETSYLVNRNKRFSGKSLL